MKSIVLFVMTLTVVSSAAAQIATGGGYTLERSVVGNGGSTISGGDYELTGTAAESVAGILSAGTGYGIRGGFWQPSFAPTAAAVSIRGRVTTAGRGLPKVRVSLTDGSGVTRSTLTSNFGYYIFDDIEIGTYIVSAQRKLYFFSDSPRVIAVQEDLSDVDFMGEPTE